MRMTEKLANDLMDCLYCVALSAAYPDGINPNIADNPSTVDKETFKAATEYAINTFESILTEFEKLNGCEWEIEVS